MTCPSPIDLERLYWSSRPGAPSSRRDVRAWEHVVQCEACRAGCAEIEHLAMLGQRVEPRSWTRREEVRTITLTTTRAAAPAEVRRSPWRYVAGPAVLVAAATLWLVWPTRASAPSAVVVNPKQRGTLLVHEGALASTVTAQPDEIVRLASGTITVTVSPLLAHERFRVITGPDEIEANGAAFDVTARDDRLATIRVLHGTVKVLANGDEARTIRAGETWRTTTALSDRPPQDAAVVVAPPPHEPRPVPRTVVQPPPEVEVEPATTASPALPDASPAPVPPQRSDAQVALDAAWAAMRDGNYPEAARAFERAMASVDPTITEDASFWRGVALARAGQVASAVTVLTEFVRAYPTSVRAGEARTVVGWLLLERGDLTAAKRHFQAAVDDPSPRVRASAQQGLAASARQPPR